MQPDRSDSRRAHLIKSSEASPLIQLDGIDVSLAGRRVLSEIHWRLLAGEHWAFLGPNGSGKSTLLKLIRGDLWPDAPGVERRSYFFDGAAQSSPIGVREKIAFVSPEQQERYWQSDWNLTAFDTVCTGFFQTDLLYQRVNDRQKTRALKIFHALRLESLRRRGIRELSAGELRKVLIARALTGEPHVLVLDEFCDGLDARARRDLIALLDSVARAGTQLLYSTHRADELVPATTHVASLRDGKLLAHGLRDKILVATSARTGAFGRGSANGQTRGDGAQQRASAVCNRQPPSAAAFFRIEKADVFLGRKKILTSLNWQMNTDENWLIVGRNGAGKSTFVKLLSGELQPAWGGRVIRFGAGDKTTIQRFRKMTGLVSPDFQSGYAEDLTGEQVVVSGFFASVGLLDRPTRKQRARARELLQRLKVVALAGKSFLKMSYGERRKILLARALVHAPCLVILDEPFDGLDSQARADFTRALEEVMRSGTRVLLVTHHLDDVPRGMTHVLALAAGEILFQGKILDARVRHELKQLFIGR
ncbi:MAG: ATP-binding cassette domain-containing protein [Verrucomicrobia bacterium]|nr:ATP-binding cassette domain-containing protein [Verrucomicrobiota bacterium]